jgi:hypothetical protein
MQSISAKPAWLLTRLDFGIPINLQEKRKCSGVFEDIGAHAGYASLLCTAYSSLRGSF